MVSMMHHVGGGTDLINSFDQLGSNQLELTGAPMLHMKESPNRRPNTRHG